MKFKEIKAGHPIYIFNKKSIELSQLLITSVGNSYYSNGTLLKVMDIIVENKTYVVPEDSAITYADNLVISVDKNLILLEIQATKGIAENIVNSYEENKLIMLKCDSILEELDDKLAEKRRYDKRFENIEEKLERLLLKLED